MSSPKFSFEFFPPKSDAARKRLWSTFDKLAPLNPDFVSVTYGAGGSTQEATFETVCHIETATPMRPAAHLTCVGATREQIDTLAQSYWDAGIRHIVALRGDSPDGTGQAYTPTPGGYAYGSDVVAGLKAVADFKISVAAYPERHPESGSWDAELDNLKRKIDAGATQAITQFFLSPETYLTYLERVRAAGITIPILPGIMLQPNFAGLSRMSKMCGVEVSSEMAEAFAAVEDDPQAREDLTLSYARQSVETLMANGVDEFHLYTLNKAGLTKRLMREF